MTIHVNSADEIQHLLKSSPTNHMKTCFSRYVVLRTVLETWFGYGQQVALLAHRPIGSPLPLGIIGTRVMHFSLPGFWDRW